MKMSEVERYLSISRATLRHYEDVKLVVPERDEKGYRNYSNDDIEKLKLILQLRSLDISIDDIYNILQRNIIWEDYLKSKKQGIYQEISKSKTIKKTINNFQKRKPLLLAIQETEKLCIGSFGKYWIDNINRQIVVYHSNISLYERIIKHKKRKQIIYYNDIEYIEITYSQFYQGLAGANCNVFLNAHIFNQDVIQFHGCIDCDKYHFLLAIGLLKKAGIKIVDKFQIEKILMDSDEKDIHIYQALKKIIKE